MSVLAGGSDRRNQPMSRVMSRPFATLLAVVSAILIVVGRINKDIWWGDWVFVAGIAVLVVAGALFVLLTKR
jgi:preprotein translocase subunit SecY